MNYHPDEVGPPAWTFDSRHVWLDPEPPGEPEPAGPWHAACRLIAEYDFCPPEIVRAVFNPTEPLLGRTMLLEGRFAALRFYLPVRITRVIDERRDHGQHVWGFSYDTVRGHLERGRLTYEVIKYAHTGDIEFTITGYSQRAPTLGPILLLGWSMFGRRQQLLFYHRCAQRITTLTRQAHRPQQRRNHPDPATGLRHAPFDASNRWLDRIALHNTDPG